MDRFKQHSFQYDKQFFFIQQNESHLKITQPTYLKSKVIIIHN